MEKKQTLKERMEEVQDNFGKLNGFENYRQYRDAGNNLARYELQDLMQQAYNLDRESPPVTGTAEEIITNSFEQYWNKIMDEVCSYLNLSDDEALKLRCHVSEVEFDEFIPMITSTESTTIERLEQEIESLTSENTDLYHNGEQLELQRTENLEYIEKLTKALEEIASFEYPHSSIEKAMIIAREALKSIKKIER